MNFDEFFYLVVFVMAELWLMLGVILDKTSILILGGIHGIVLFILSEKETKVKSKRRLKK